MALKPDRKITDGTDISYFMNVTAEKGSVVIIPAAGGGSGAAMDDGSALLTLPTAAYGSGQYPFGILLCDVVSGDLTKTHLNYHKDEVQVGGKVTVLRRGVVTTNMIDGTTALAGKPAFISATATDGKLTAIALAVTTLASQHSGVEVTNPMLTRVGTWLSNKDADGYAKLEVNLI